MQQKKCVQMSHLLGHAYEYDYQTAAKQPFKFRFVYFFSDNLYTPTFDIYFY